MSQKVKPWHRRHRRPKRKAIPGALKKERHKFQRLRQEVARTPVPLELDPLAP